MYSSFSLTKPEQLCIDVYSTYYTIEADPKGYLFKGLYDIRSVLNKLRVPVFNGHGVYIDSIRYYRYVNGKFHFPRNTLETMEKVLQEIVDLDHFFSYSVTFHDPNPIRTIPSLVMKPNWKDRPEHEAALKHLTDTSRPIRGNNLQTGKGKTYVGVKTSTILSCPTLVICESLVDNWIENYLEKTKVSPDRIYTLQGVESIVMLWQLLNSRNDQDPYILVGSLKTLVNYTDYVESPYTSVPTLNDLCIRLGVGMVIHDEIHLATNAHVRIDLTLNVANTIVLSATPKRTDKQEQAIFNRIFPKGTIDGANVYDKYVNTRIVPYDLNTHRSEKKFVNFGYGYSHIKYESVLVESPSLREEFFKFIDRAICADYLNRAIPKEDKCLVFVSTVRMAEWLQKRIEQQYSSSGTVVNTYLHHDPIDNLKNSDIIVSTPKSCGVGKDIGGLITVVNTVSLASEPGLEQMFGRLRKLEGKECRFIDLVNKTIDSQMRHLKTKKAVYQTRSVNFEIGDL